MLNYYSKLKIAYISYDAASSTHITQDKFNIIVLMQK